MSSDGLKTEVSTDIILYENKEIGGSGVVFIVRVFTTCCYNQENIPEFCEKERIALSTLYSVCQVLREYGVLSFIVILQPFQ